MNKCEHYHPHLKIALMRHDCLYYNNDLLLYRLGAACPPNYNPADHFIQLLAGVPGREETTRTTIDTVCTAFAKSEIGCKIAAEAENALYYEVCINSGLDR